MILNVGLTMTPEWIAAEESGRYCETVPGL
jgi:hypothetical protein